MALSLRHGKAVLKAKASSGAALDLGGLPFRSDLIEFLKEERRNGRKVILVTAADQALAAQVSAHLGLFDEVLASDGKTNLKGATKRDLLIERFGERGFDYIGNDRSDEPVWAASRNAYVVSRSSALLRRVQQRRP
jgi:phosphoserine phosphatase